MLRGIRATGIQEPPANYGDCNYPNGHLEYCLSTTAVLGEVWIGPRAEDAGSTFALPDVTCVPMVRPLIALGIHRRHHVAVVTVTVRPVVEQLSSDSSLWEARMPNFQLLAARTRSLVDWVGVAVIGSFSPASE
jgi:hypothetical protein